MSGNRTHHHQHGTHFRFEKVSSHILGPLRLAREALNRANAVPLSEEGFLDHLFLHYPAMYDALEWVRFHTFPPLDTKSRPNPYRIAEINLAPDPRIRDALFEQRQSITAATGW